MNRSPGTWQWDDVRHLLAVARTGSLSGAARALGVGHVTVGRRIALLEKRLGVTLLNRTPDGFATTSAGDAVLRQCMAMERAALDLERIAAGRDLLLAGSVRVTTTEALAFQLVAPAIAVMRRTHPELRVDLVAGARSLDVARRDADLAVRFARPSTSDLVCRKLGEVGFTLYASERYLARAGVPQRGQGLAGHDLVGFTGAPAATSPFFMSESLEGARVVFRCDNPLIQLKAAAEELGIVELACFLGDSSHDLVRVWPQEAPAKRSAWLVIHPDMRRSARIKAVSAAISDAFRRQRRILETGLQGIAN
jgi:DNA-binding transcriptional LysR family regulator